MPAHNTFTDELFEKILDLHAEGETVASILRREGMPKSRTFYDWLDADPGREKRFRQARKVGIDTIADRSRATARGKKEDEGGESSGDVQRDRLIIEQDNKLLSKWDTARYGDKINLADADGEKLPTSIAIELVRPK